MKEKQRRTGNKLIVGLVLVLLIAGLFYLISRNMGVEEKVTVNSDIVESTLKEAKELTTLKYHYKNVASYENSQELQGFTLPFTTKRFLYSYEGDISAGVDLDQAKASVDEEKKVINITLPETRILSHEIDENSVMFFDEKESVFNQLKLEDYSTFRSEEKVKVETEAISRGLLDEAAEVTNKAVLEILKINPTIDEEYTINIKYKEAGAN